MTRKTLTQALLGAAALPWVMATAAGRDALTAGGTVTVTGRSVRFPRAGLVEEYSVSMDGIRQDFIVEQPPGGPGSPRGELVVTLAVTGAKVEAAAYGAQLVLEKSGRKIAYPARFYRACIPP